MTPKVIISLVTYNGQKYIPYLLPSIKAQTFSDWELIILDNASVDLTHDAIKETTVKHTYLPQKKNIGFAAGHNKIINWSESEYVLVINQDIFLEPDFLKTLVDFMESHPHVASVGGKTLHWNFDQHDKTNIIDSCGLHIDKRYHVSERLQGRGDEAPASEPVFGISGAVVLYRRQALLNTAIPKRVGSQHMEYFDEDFFAYKEDVDLAWRLRRNGWENYFVAEAVAYHDRSLTHRTSGFKERRLRSSLNRLSYRNHLCLMRKNSSPAIFWRFFHKIIPYEIAKFFYLIILDRSSLKGLYEYIKLRRRMNYKRKIIKKYTTVETEELLKWFI